MQVDTHQAALSALRRVIRGY